MNIVEMRNGAIEIDMRPASQRIATCWSLKLELAYFSNKVFELRYVHCLFILYAISHLVDHSII
jgi:hypothetical protein